jgi:predicted phage terminase large subunit-like protein
VPNYKASEGLPSEANLIDALSLSGAKLLWFLRSSYTPHAWQQLFHTMRTEKGRITRFRHLAAGRRGGKTLSAAWECAYYLVHPEEYWKDFHDKESDKPILLWCLTENFSFSQAAYRAFKEVLDQAKLQHGVDYWERKGDRFFEFPDGSIIYFRSADNPNALRGSGLHGLWIDEAAFLRNEEAWITVRPALADKQGFVITTTTPDGKNWFWETFFAPEHLDSPFQGRVEYRSIDNPYFPKDEWEEQMKSMHPLIFRREYMAAFDAMAGKELQYDWLKFYKPDDLPPLKEMRVYIGVDPAISMAERADKFVLTVVGVKKDNTNAYIIEQFVGKIPFHEQLDKITEFHHKYHPMMIGIESTAYQVALVQQSMRLPGLPNVVPMFAKGKKHERILAMSPSFKVGRVLIHEGMKDFIQEWIDYDPELKNPKDDCLDSAEIAMRTAGILLPGTYEEDVEPEAITLKERLRKHMEDAFGDSDQGFDEFLGTEW